MLTVLRVVREPSLEGTTMGSLYLNGHWQCWTLEDEIRETGQPVAEWKIAGKTAIPAGRYGVRLSLSQRFKRILPELLDVPGFTGVRLHRGNTIEDTEGCLLVGRKRGGRQVQESGLAEDELITVLRERIEQHQDTVVVDIENPPGTYFATGSAV